MITKTIEVSGKVRSRAYMNGTLQMPGEKVTFTGLVSSEKSLITSNVELDEESKVLVEKTIKELKAADTKSKAKATSSKVAPAATKGKPVVNLEAETGDKSLV